MCPTPLIWSLSSEYEPAQKPLSSTSDPLSSEPGTTRPTAVIEFPYVRAPVERPCLAATPAFIGAAGIGSVHRVVRYKRIGIRSRRCPWDQERVAAEEAADGGVVEAGAELGGGEGRRGG